MFWGAAAAMALCQSGVLATSAADEYRAIRDIVPIAGVLSIQKLVSRGPILYILDQQRHQLLVRNT
jgi:hypothetical protein